MDTVLGIAALVAAYVAAQAVVLLRGDRGDAGPSTPAEPRTATPVTR
jgi:hypothetical protein